MRLPFHHFVWAGALLSMLLASGGRAQVAADQKAAAEALFDRGLELMRQGEFPRACAYLEQSQAVESGIGTMLYLAECYEKLGRTASAWALFREASSAAQAEGQAERAQAGSTRAAQLEPQLAKLTLLVSPESQVPGLEVLRNGVLVPSAVWGLAVPVDPGPQLLEARAPGHHAWTQTEQVAKAAALSVTIPALAAAPAPAVAEAPVSAPLPAQVAGAAPAVDSTRPSDGNSWQRTTAFVTGGVGLAALAVGTYFGIRAASKNSEAEDYCPDNGPSCISEANELTDQAQTSATFANVFVFGGAALAATGLVLYLTAPSESGTVVAISARAGGAAIVLGGTL